MKRVRIRLRGIVQGVGFRPFVHNLAARWQLAGYVLNSSAGLLAEVEGAAVEEVRLPLQQRQLLRQRRLPRQRQRPEVEAVEAAAVVRRRAAPLRRRALLRLQP